MEHYIKMIYREALINKASLSIEVLPKGIIITATNLTKSVSAKYVLRSQ